MPESDLRRYGFVMEQTLGHVTHYANLRAAVEATSGVEATWYPLSFEPRGPIQRLPPFDRNWSSRASLQAQSRLRRVRDSTLDAIFFHTQVSTLLSTGLLRRVPGVISLDATPSNYDSVGGAYGHARSSEMVERIKRAINVRPLRAARAIVTWCDWAKRSLVEEYGVDGELVTVIAPGVDLSLWPSPSRRDSDGTLSILFVGGDFQRKGGEELLEAVRDLTVPVEVHLVTQAEVDPRPGVHVHRGLKPNSEALRDLYAAADVFVLPTVADCFPLVIQEAMAAGLPVVSTDVGAIGEAVQEGSTGMLVPPGEVRPLRDALTVLAAHPGKRAEMGAAAREYAQRHYDSRRNAERILEIMDRVSERGR